MKVKVEIETTDIFKFTSSYKEDSKIVEELLGSLEDDSLVQAIIDRGLYKELFDSLSANEQESIIDNYANDYGYFKSED